MLEQADLPAERGLRHVQALRSPTEVELVSDGNEAAKLTDFEHDSIPESIESVFDLIMHQSNETITSIEKADDPLRVQKRSYEDP